MTCPQLYHENYGFRFRSPYRIWTFQVIHFDYEHFEGNISGNTNKLSSLNFRTKDWGPAPRWVAFVDFFLASRAKHAVISGAHRRVGTTYAQLIAALAASYIIGNPTLSFQKLPSLFLTILFPLSTDENASIKSSITFLSSFQSNLLSEGLKNQVGWGHVWNRFAGSLSCQNQPNQCALTPVLPPAWWDGLWQSPIPRDSQRMEAYGIKLSGFGTFNESHLARLCRSRKVPVVVLQLIQIFNLSFRFCFVVHLLILLTTLFWHVHMRTVFKGY